MDMKKVHLLLLSLFSGLLLTFSWPAGGFPGLLFIGFIPLLFIEDHIHKHPKDFHLFSPLFYSYPAFLIWNGLTTWWVWNSTPVGGVAAIVVNAFLMSLVVSLFHISKRAVFAPGKGHFILVFYWITFELLHLNWELNWPWLNLGNGFANYVKWIQWYEFTGAFGGTLWVLVVNILLYHLIRISLSGKMQVWTAAVFGSGAFIMLAGPLLFSYIQYHTYQEEENPVNVVVVQPNVDPYHEQFILPPAEVVERNLGLAEELVDEQTELIVSPESAIQEEIWEGQLHYSGTLRLLKKYVTEHPGLGIIIGASTRKEYLSGEGVSPTARKFVDANRYYDRYNTAFYIDTAEITQWTHKSKLTPGVERMPYPQYFKFLEDYAIDLGGTIGSLGTDIQRKVFTRSGDSLKFAAAICYESVFGQFFSGFVRNGAMLMFVVTNDGWWGDTPGHRQHLSFSRLRAIECRRSIGRSANTGISCFINQRGDVSMATKYWVTAVIRKDINANDKITFYTRYGDFIARISLFIAGIMVLYTIAAALMHRKKLKK